VTARITGTPLTSAFAEDQFVDDQFADDLKPQLGMISTVALLKKRRTDGDLSDTVRWANTSLKVYYGVTASNVRCRRALAQLSTLRIKIQHHDTVLAECCFSNVHKHDSVIE
jgi:hypothetical protein